MQRPIRRALTSSTTASAPASGSLAAFLPTASPRVASVYFGTDVDDVNFDAGSNYGLCGPAGTQQVPDQGWPYDVGNSVGFGTPVLGNTLFRFYAFGLDNYDDDPALPNPWWCSAINPTGGYAAFFDDSFPPNEDRITQFGCVKWYEPGYNDCPGMIPISGACCFATGECVVLLGRLRGPAWQLCRRRHDLRARQPLRPAWRVLRPRDRRLPRSFSRPIAWLPFVFHGGVCEPTNPCPQRGACCDPVTGACVYTYEADCIDPMVWHPEYTTCVPNYCPPPVPTEGTTWGQIKATYR